MKAAVYKKYGSPEVLSVQEMPRPVPGPNEILVKVHASTVNSGDARMRGFRAPGIFWLPMRLMLGISGPRNPIAGQEFAGVIKAVGPSVTRFKAGNQVFGMTWLHGANAEYVTIREDALVTCKPNGLADMDAAAIPFGALSALVFLRDLGRLQRGQKVLVYGASGCVGVFAVQLAKHFGASVTGVCSTGNVGMVQSLGADEVIDYTKQDFTTLAASYDLIFDTVGVASLNQCRRVMTPTGRLVFLSAGLSQILQALWTSFQLGKRAVFGVPGNTSADLEYIRGLIAAGKIRPVIDRTYGLDEIVEAHRHVDTGRKRGSVVLNMDL